MKITIYELLGTVKDKVDIDTYIRYYDKLDNKTDIMLACKENIIYNLDRTSIELNDTVEILEEKKIPEKLNWKPKESMAGELTQKEKIEVIARRTEKLKKEFNNLLDYLKNKGDE